MMHEFRGTIRVTEEGKGRMFDKQTFDKFLSLHPGEIFEVKVSRRRTTPQRGYYWVLMEILGKEVGMSKDETHEVVKFKFLQEECINEATGEVFTRVKSTTELSKMEMAAYIDQIIVWAADQLHITLPEAGENIKLKFDI